MENVSNEADHLVPTFRHKKTCLIFLYSSDFISLLTPVKTVIQGNVHSTITVLYMQYCAEVLLLSVKYLPRSQRRVFSVLQAF